MKELVKQFIENQYKNTEIAIGYIVDGKAYFEGILKRDKEVIEVENSKALFEIGSITKVFTTTILAQLINEGKVDGDTLISNILPYKALKGTGITLKSLANHTSGLPRLPENFYSIKNHDERNPYLNYNEDALIAYFENIIKQKSKVNITFEYSNLGSGVLGYVISKIENLPFEKVVRDRIFLPLGMQSTSFDINKKKNIRIKSERGALKQLGGRNS